MEIKNYFAQDAQGNIGPSANCYLYLPGTTTLATGLVDGNGTPISNPFLASSVGQIEFGAPNGVYDLRVVLGARDWTIKVQCADIVQAMDVMDSILGSHAENPTTRNNGQSLEPGDETWNSTEKQPYWWNGTSWVSLNSSAQQLEERLADPAKGAGMVGYGDGSVADKLDEIVSGAVTEPLVDAKVYTHNEDANSHPELRTRIVSEVSSHVTNEADRAESAADAAQLCAGVYPNTASGIAATTEGQYFSVPSDEDDEYLILYQHGASGSAAEIKRNPSALAVEALAGNFTGRDDSFGYSWGVLDKDDRLALGLTQSGRLVNKGVDLLSVSESIADRDDRSGYAWGVLDSSGRIALGLDYSGRLVNKGVDILTAAEAANADQRIWITPLKDIVSYGDSMSNGTWQPFLRTLLPERSITVNAIGGQQCSQIGRRQGGITALLQVQGGSIPAGGAVTIVPDVDFLNEYLVPKIVGSIRGVPGVLSLSGGVYTFTRSVNGDAVAVDEQEPFVKSNADGHRFATTIIWAGTNDYAVDVRALIDEKVTAMVDYLLPLDKRFIVLGVAIADVGERRRGTQYFADIEALHLKWKAKWPNNFMDITRVLQRYAAPSNTEDAQDVADGVIPASLRYDTLHLNDAGNEIVANELFKFIQVRGW